MLTTVGGRLYDSRRKRHRRQHRSPLHLRRRNTALRFIDVRCIRPRLGQQFIGLYFASIHSCAGAFLVLWREDTDKSEVPGAVLDGICMGTVKSIDSLKLHMHFHGRSYFESI